MTKFKKVSNSHVIIVIMAKNQIDISFDEGRKNKSGIKF